MRFTFGSDENVLNLTVVVTHILEYPKKPLNSTLNATLDLEVVSSSPTLDVEITQEK